MLINISDRPILAPKKQWVALGNAFDGKKYLVQLTLEYRRGDHVGYWRMKVYHWAERGRLCRAYIHPFLGVIKPFGRIDLDVIEKTFVEAVSAWNEKPKTYRENWADLELKFLSKNPNDFKAH